MNLTLRQAVPADILVLRALIDASVRGLQAADYSSTQIESALQTVYGVDSQLIADGTYFVVEAGPEPVIVGCGGLEQTQDTLWWRPLDGPGRLPA